MKDNRRAASARWTRILSAGLLCAIPFITSSSSSSLCVAATTSTSTSTSTTASSAVTMHDEESNGHVDVALDQLRSLQGDGGDGTNSTDGNSTDTNTNSTDGNTTDIDGSSDSPTQTPTSQPTQAGTDDTNDGDAGDGSDFTYDDTIELGHATKFSVPSNDDATKDDDKTLYIHIVPHTHDDVGWLKTVDQYYHGLNNSIREVNVQAILTTSMDALKENENRTFVYVEQKFFSQWWLKQSKLKKKLVRRLVNTTNQLSFVNGAWSMHDEAAAHYLAMIDQTTTGHTFLNLELGAIPKVGWQLDPFGHSSSQASYFTHKMGFDALYMGRIDHQDLAQRHDQRQCEGFWKASQDGNLGSKADTSIFWGLTGSYGGNYGAPDGFDFLTGVSSADDADPLLQDLTLPAMLTRLDEVLLPQLVTQANRTQGHHMMVTMGTDFRYQDAPAAFRSNDLLIQGVNAIQDVNPARIKALFGDLGFDKLHIFYSSPDYYTEWKYKELQQKADAASPSYDEKRDDFFPYADNTNAYWTGYFTSRPALKRLIRQASAIFNSARQMEALLGKLREINRLEHHHNSPTLRCDCGWSLFPLEDALGIAQHHDAITGTSKQHVAYDYAKRISHGISKAMTMIKQQLRHVLVFQDKAFQMNDLDYCQLLNETKCDVAVAQTSSDATDDGNDVLAIIVYNALAQARNTYVRLPVGSEGRYHVTCKGCNATNDTTLTVDSMPVSASKFDDGAGQYITWNSGELPPTGMGVYTIAKVPQTTEVATAESPAVEISAPAASTQHRTVSNAKFQAEFDDSGTLQSIQMKGSSHKHDMDVKQQWGYYESYQDDTDATDTTPNKRQNSGAYIFRPKDSGKDSMVPLSAKAGGAEFVASSNDDVVEIRSNFDVDWLSQVIRVYADKDYMEVEYTVGPIDVSDGRGKEIVSRYTSAGMKSGTCKTDSNGREFLERKWNHRPTWDLDVSEEIAGNYYPVTAGISFETSDEFMAIVTDRSVGGMCIDDGDDSSDKALEVMVHRRMINDDSRGVGEALDETDQGMTPYPPYGDATRVGDGLIIRGTHRLIFGKANDASESIRTNMDDIFMEPLLFAGSLFQDGGKQHSTFNDISAISRNNALPKNVMLMTYTRQKPDLYLVRLGHQFSVGEDATLSKTATVDLQVLFDGYAISKVTEMTLSANQKYADWNDRRIDWRGSGPLPDPIASDDTIVSLEPMDIRTFLVKVELNTKGSPSHPHSSAPHATHVPAPTSAPHQHFGTPQKQSERKESKGFPMGVVYGVLATLAVIGVGLVVRRFGRYRQFDRAAGTDDLDFELSVQGYQPGMT